jgi:hypothetical protein
MARVRKPKLVKLTIRLTLDDQQALDSIAQTLERDASWVLAKLAHLSAGTVDLSTEVRRWLRGDTAFDAGIKGDQRALLVIGNDDPPVVRAARRKTVAEDPPTIAEVERYINEKAYGFSAEEFVGHYTACGWVQGNSKKPLVDWKAACVTWQASWLQKNGAPTAAASDWGKNRPAELDAPPADDQTADLPLEEPDAGPDGFLEDNEA